MFNCQLRWSKPRIISVKSVKLTQKYICDSKTFPIMSSLLNTIPHSLDFFRINLMHMKALRLHNLITFWKQEIIPKPCNIWKYQAGTMVCFGNLWPSLSRESLTYICSESIPLPSLRSQFFKTNIATTAGWTKQGYCRRV